MDILIAWHIDSSQPEHVISYVSSALIELRPYWLKDLEFTITLLYQFLEDMESYVVQDGSSTASKRKDFDAIEKMAALFK